MTAREIADKFFEQVWNQRQLDLADSLFPADFVAKPIAYQAPWTGTGPESIKHHIQKWLEGLPDLHMETIESIAQGNQVVVRWEMTGTHSGVLHGVPATGRSIKGLGVSFFEIEDGKIRDILTAFDWLGLMQQLSVLPDTGTIIQNHLSQLEGQPVA